MASTFAKSPVVLHVLRTTRGINARVSTLITLRACNAHYVRSVVHAANFFQIHESRRAVSCHVSTRYTMSGLDSQPISGLVVDETVPSVPSTQFLSRQSPCGPLHINPHSLNMISYFQGENSSASVCRSHVSYDTRISYCLRTVVYRIVCAEQKQPSTPMPYTTE